jgi:transcriptional regulator with XRE-family HTH domain
MKNKGRRRAPNCLRKYRRARGLKQKEVAQMLGLKSASQISRWEKGLCMPSLLNAFKLALLYRRVVEALFIDLRRELKDELHKKEETLNLGDE